MDAAGCRWPDASQSLVLAILNRAALMGSCHDKSALGKLSRDLHVVTKASACIHINKSGTTMSHGCLCHHVEQKLGPRS